MNVISAQSYTLRAAQSDCLKPFDKPACSLQEGRAGEQGWALLGLLLALSVIAIVMVSAVVPNVKMSVQREKEAELIYRGEQMAKAIARYYNQGRLGFVTILRPPAYGYLTDLDKLRDGVTLGVTEIKFVRGSAMIDPMTNDEWEPVVARDPRIRKFLDYYTANSGIVIPDEYWLLAGPPQKLQLINPGNPTTGPPSGTPESRELPPGRIRRPDADPGDDDDDDDEDEDDDEVVDPLAHIFNRDENETLGRSSIPIVGVAPRRKGPSVRNYYGLENYEDWVFIFVPDPRQFPQLNPRINPRLPNTNRPRIGQ